MGIDLKSEFLKLLDKDIEFRYAVAGYLGISEILKKLDALFEEQRKLWENQNKLLENQNKLWESQNKLWEEVKNLREDFLRLERNIHALGARWGIMAESAFRNSLKGLLEKSFNIKVERWTDHDDEGLVYGYPSVVEVDVALRDQELILIEITSHAKKSDITLFNRKAIFYEKKTGKKPSRLIIVTPYAEDDTKELAKQLKIELYTNV